MKEMQNVQAKRKQEIEDAISPAGDKERTGVQSLKRAFNILEEVARNRQGINLAELGKRVGLHNSTTFHLVKTMVSLGYVMQSRDTKRYRIGRRLFVLAASSLDEIELVNVATPILEDLAHQTGEATHFAVRSGDEVVIVAKTAGAGAIQMADRVGVVRPAHATALGKVLLAALTPEQLRRYVNGQSLRAFTPSTITEPAALIEAVGAVRSDGVAYDDAEFDSEVRCVAVPVYDFTGQVAGALGISGPIWRLSIQVLQAKTELVKRAAARMSEELGWQETNETGAEDEAEEVVK